MAERRNRKHSKIDGLPPDLKATVQQMLLDGDTYSEVIAYLQTQGVSISMSSVCRYAQAYLAEHEALMMANANLQRMMDEVSKYPDLDTTEAIIRIVSHNLLNVLSNTSEEDWQETSCFRLTVDQTGEQNGKILSTLWLRQEDGTPLRGEIAVDGEIILTADFTSFSFYDTIENQE